MPTRNLPPSPPVPARQRQPTKPPPSDTEGFEDVEQEDVGEWDWDEGQREEVADEFGAEFESGADIADEDGQGSTEEVTEDGTEREASEDGDDEPATAESAETVVMDIIEEENGEKGAERSTILEKAAERGIDEEVAEGTLEDLLLEGMCYPTDGDRIKPL